MTSELGLSWLIILGSATGVTQCSVIVLLGASLMLGLLLWLFYFLNRQSQERQQAEANFQDLYNNAPCGYHSVDKDGVFIAINDTELRWLGYLSSLRMWNRFNKHFAASSPRVG